MKAAVEAVAPNWDLSQGNEAVNTIKLAAEIEAEMNYIKEEARFGTADADKSFRTAVAAAKTEKEVNKVTDSVVGFVTGFQKEMTDRLNGVIEKGRADPKLEDRIPDAEAYRDEILDA